MSARKEPHFFSRAELTRDVPDGQSPARAVADLRTYEKFFATTEAPTRGESSTTYLWSDKAASRIAEYSESARIVAIVRNPIDRAFSHYLHNLRRGSQYNDLGAHLRMFTGDPEGERWPHIYLTGGWGGGGLYADGIERFQTHFPGRVQVLVFEELITRPKEHMSELLGFLGVDPGYAEHVDFPFRNGFQRPRSPLSSVLLRGGWAFRTARRILPESAKRALKSTFFSGSDRPHLDPAIRSNLADFFAEDVVALERRLDRRLPWPDFGA